MSQLDSIHMLAWLAAFLSHNTCFPFAQAAKRLCVCRVQGQQGRRRRSEHTGSIYHWGTRDHGERIFQGQRPREFPCPASALVLCLSLKICQKSMQIIRTSIQSTHLQRTCSAVFECFDNLAHIMPPLCQPSGVSLKGGPQDAS